MRAAIHTSVLFILSLALFSCGSKVTKQNLEKIEAGMTVQQVRSILGSPAEDKTKEVPLVGLSGWMVWKSGEKTITVTFGQGKVLTSHGQNL